MTNEPLWVEDGLPSRVFESLSADYFHVAGRTFLVYVDRLSGWPYVTVCPQTASTDHLVKQLRQLFSQTGVPVTLRTDGGPQFVSSTVRRFLDRWGVCHELSSPRDPRSNGHAEAAVKTAKKIVVAGAAGWMMISLTEACLNCGIRHGQTGGHRPRRCLATR